MRVRSALAVIAAAAASATALAPAPASAAPKYWFGEFETFDFGGTRTTPDRTTAVALIPRQKDGGLPFHTFSTVALYDCSGAQVWSNYGSELAVKESGKKWVTTSTAVLDFPDKNAEYDRFEVTVHGKGRAPVTTTVRSSKNFTLGCNGGTTIKAGFTSRVGQVSKPASAHFDLSPEKAIAKFARFGTPVGKARVGTSVRIKGAKVVGRRAGDRECLTFADITYAKNRKLGASDVAKCGKKVKITRKAYFVKPSGGAVQRPVEGSALVLASGITTGGHTFIREFSLGKIKAKK